MPAVYGLDVSDVSRWEETVLEPALQILHSLTKVGSMVASLSSFPSNSFLSLAQPSVYFDKTLF